MPSIKLSEKHGVNPSMCQCFFCGETKGIALMGKLKGDAEAPRQCVLDYEPCEKCQSMMNQGVTLIEVSETQPLDGRPPVKAQGGREVYPLGSWLVMRPDAVKRLFNADMSAGQCVFVDSEIIKRLNEMAESSK